MSSLSLADSRDLVDHHLCSNRSSVTAYLTPIMGTGLDLIEGTPWQYRLMTLNLPDYSTYGYQVTKALGHNCQASRATYLASCLTPNQEAVVIKHFRFAQSDSSWLHYSSYEQEIKLLQQIDHPSIPHYLNSFETPDGFCLVQEYKPAPSLAEASRWTPADIMQIAIAVLEVLTYLQQQPQPILHRDLKPENILVNPKDPTQVYLVDFGFARRMDENIAHSSFIKGTLGFMSPEQVFNRSLTTASDLYGLGATLICLLSGTKSVNVGELIDDQFRFNLTQLPKLDSEFFKWLEKMVEPKAVNRYPNAASALADLKLIKSGRQVSSQPSTIAILCSLLFGFLSIVSFAFWIGRSPQTSAFQPEPTSPFVPEDEAAVLENLRFQAIHFAHTSLNPITSYGTFTAKGVIADTLRPIPSISPYEIRHLVFDTRRQEFYGLNMHDLMKFELERQTIAEVKPKGLPRLSWPTGIALDTRRDRLIVANTRSGVFYSHSLTLNQWSVLGKIGAISDTEGHREIEALAYSDEEDVLYGITRSYLEGSLRYIDLVAYNANGAMIKTLRLSLPKPIGIDKDRPGEARTQLISVGKYLVVLIYALPHIQQNSQVYRIYLLNPRTERIVTAP
jgi:serine/threonine protein kinase